MLRFVMINSALHLPIFLAIAEPILVASDVVSGCERVHSDTYALSSHCITSKCKASSTKRTGSIAGTREEISRIARSRISSKSYRVEIERSNVQCSCGDRTSPPLRQVRRDNGGNQ